MKVLKEEGRKGRREGERKGERKENREREEKKKKERKKCREHIAIASRLRVLCLFPGLS